MRIVNRETFLAMPPNTVFQKYEPYCRGVLNIKMDTIPESGDFFETDLNDVNDIRKDGSFTAADFDAESRDACFDDKQQFIVWDEDDVAGLIERLMKCLGRKVIKLTTQEELDSYFAKIRAESGGCDDEG